MRGALSVRTRAVISGVRSSEAVGCANKSGGRAAWEHLPSPRPASLRRKIATYYIQLYRNF